MVVFKCKSAGEVWLQSMKLVLEQGVAVSDKDALLEKHEFPRLKEVRNVCFEIDEIDFNDPILRGYEHYLPEYKGKLETNLRPANEYFVEYYSRNAPPHGYGRKIYAQYNWLVNHLKAKPETKSATITLPPLEDGRAACITALDFKYRNRKLYMNVVYRSNNAFYKVPANLLALGDLHKEIAKDLNFEVGSIEWITFSLHFYEPDYKSAIEILGKNGIEVNIRGQTWEYA
jgi:thymidylate synthase